MKHSIKDNIQVKNYYKIYCNTLKKVINDVKKQFFHKQVAALSNKVKTAWKIIKGNFGNSYYDDTTTKINYGNASLINPKEIANAFNKCYTNIITNLNIEHSDMYEASKLLNNLKLRNTVQMETIPVSEAEVINTIKFLKSKKYSRV
jgi:hypothetical protein